MLLLVGLFFCAGIYPLIGSLRDMLEVLRGQMQITGCHLQILMTKQKPDGAQVQRRAEPPLQSPSAASMTRPAIEVADIVRAQGRQFLERYQSTAAASAAPSASFLSPNGK